MSDNTPLTFTDLDNDQLAETLHILADRIEERGVTGVEMNVESSHEIGRPVLELTIKRALLDGDQALLDMIDFESPNGSRTLD